MGRLEDLVELDDAGAVATGIEDGHLVEDLVAQVGGSPLPKVLGREHRARSPLPTSTHRRILPSETHTKRTN